MSYLKTIEDVEYEKVLKAKMTKVSIMELMEGTSYDCDVYFRDGLTLKVDIYDNPNKGTKKTTFKNRGKHMITSSFEFNEDFEIENLGAFYLFVRNQFSKTSLKEQNRKNKSKSGLTIDGRKKGGRPKRDKGAIKMDFKVFEFDGTKYVTFNALKIVQTTFDEEYAVQCDCYLLDDVIEQLHNQEIRVGKFIVYQAVFKGEKIGDVADSLTEK